MSEVHGEEYRGPSGIARDSNWLSSEDLPLGRDVPAQIESVIFHKHLTMQGGRPLNNKIALRFQGKARELLLNATNRKTLVALFGATCADWFGKRVLLFIEEGVRRPDGTHGPAVRIRARRIEQPQPADDRVEGGDMDTEAST